METKTTCAICGKEIDRKDAVIDNGYYLCKECDVEHSILAGAQWADEHPISGEQIAAMKNEIKFLKRKLVECDKMYRELQNKNPWRDAKTNPPKEGQDVFAHVPNLCGGEYCKLTYLGNYRWSQDEGEWTTEFYNNEVRWMPIPEGGEA